MYTIAYRKVTVTNEPALLIAACWSICREFWKNEWNVCVPWIYEKLRILGKYCLVR